MSLFGSYANATHYEREVSNTPITVLASAVVLYGIEVDNSNGTEDVYLKIYESAPTVGTTPPSCIFPIKAGVNQPVLDLTGTDTDGLQLDALYMACVTTGGTAGATAPKSPIKVTIKMD